MTLLYCLSHPWCILYSRWKYYVPDPSRLIWFWNTFPTHTPFLFDKIFCSNSGIKHTLENVLHLLDNCSSFISNCFWFLLYYFVDKISYNEGIKIKDEPCDQGPNNRILVWSSLLRSFLRDLYLSHTRKYGKQELNMNSEEKDPLHFSKAVWAQYGLFHCYFKT